MLISGDLEHGDFGPIIHYYCETHILLKLNFQSENSKYYQCITVQQGDLFFSDIALDLTLYVPLYTDQCLLTPFFDLKHNQGTRTNQILAGLRPAKCSQFCPNCNFKRLLCLGFASNRKMVVVNIDQYPIVHLMSRRELCLKIWLTLLCMLSHFDGAAAAALLIAAAAVSSPR